MAQRVGRGIALLFRDHGTRRGEWSAARPGRTLPPGKTRYPLYSRLGGPQGRSGRAENLAPTGIRSPDRPARSQSLYRLSYTHTPSPPIHTYINQNSSVHFRQDGHKPNGFRRTSVVVANCATYISEFCVAAV